MRTISIVLIICLSFGIIVSLYQCYGADADESVLNSSILKDFVESPAPERASPKDRISEDQIHVYDDHVSIQVANLTWATFEGTNSMDPLVDVGVNALEMNVSSPADLQEGDVVSYRSEYVDGAIFHRIIEIGEDDEGWFAIVKGDNNFGRDPGKIRFAQIDRVLVAVIY